MHHRLYQHACTLAAGDALPADSPRWSTGTAALGIFDPMHTMLWLALCVCSQNDKSQFWQMTRGTYRKPVYIYRPGRGHNTSFRLPLGKPMRGCQHLARCIADQEKASNLVILYKRIGEAWSRHIHRRSKKPQHPSRTHRSHFFRSQSVKMGGVDYHWKCNVASKCFALAVIVVVLRETHFCAWSIRSFSMSDLGPSQILFVSLPSMEQIL